MKANEIINKNNNQFPNQSTKFTSGGFQFSPKQNFYSWVSSDHFQLKAFFITLLIFALPLIIFIIFISAMTQGKDTIATVSLVAYAVFYDLLRRWISSRLKERKLNKTLIEENDELKMKLKQKRRQNGKANRKK